MNKRTRLHSFNSKQLHILNIALEIFAIKGYNGASVREISQASNVNLAMINYYFGSKLQLLEAIFQYMYSKSKEQLDKVIQDESKSPFEKIELIIDGYTKFAIDNKYFIVLMMRHQYSNNSDVVQEYINNLKLKYWKIFHSAFEDAKRKKVFITDLNITTILVMIMGSLSHLVSDKRFISNVEKIKEDDAYDHSIIYSTMNQVKKILLSYINKENGN